MHVTSTKLSRICVTVILSLILSACSLLDREFTDYETKLLNEHSPEKQDISTEGELKLTYFGVSTILISDGNNKILIDGFMSRPKLEDLIIGQIEPNEKALSSFIADYKLQDLDVIIPVHSHHDHAMDAPFIASKTGALLWGSDSTLKINAEAYGESRKVISTTDTLFKEFGEFKITLLPSKHTSIPWPISAIIGMNENIDEPFTFPASLGDFKEGQSYSVFIEHSKASIFIHANTSVVPTFNKPFKADWLFMGIARFDRLPDDSEFAYQKLIQHLEPKVIVPIHWDDFMRAGLELKPSKCLFGNFTNEINAILNLNKPSEKTSKHSAKVVLLQGNDTVYLDRVNENN